MNLAFLHELLNSRRGRTSVACVTELQGGAQKLVTQDRCFGDLDLSDAELAEVRRALAEDRSQLAQVPSRELFIEVWSIAPRLIIVGAVHIAQPLVAVARLMGFEVVMVDPRASFASKSRFPDMPLIVDWPDAAIPRLVPDGHTAVVTLTHNPRIDDAALIAALRSEAFYIGALGSRRTHEQRKQRLVRVGCDPAMQDRIRAPVGLAIGAASPGEIAVSIAAEIIAVLRSAPLGVRT